MTNPRPSPEWVAHYRRANTVGTVNVFRRSNYPLSAGLALHNAIMILDEKFGIDGYEIVGLMRSDMATESVPEVAPVAVESATEPVAEPVAA